MKATIVYECSHSLRADGIYAVVIADCDIDVQEAIYTAKAKAVEKYGDDWTLDDIYKSLDFECEIFEQSSLALAEV